MALIIGSTISEDEILIWDALGYIWRVPYSCWSPSPVGWEVTLLPASNTPIDVLEAAWFVVSCHRAIVPGGLRVHGTDWRPRPTFLELEERVIL